MKKFKGFARDHPILFSLVITLMVLLFYIAAAILAEAQSLDRAGYEITEAIGRLAAALFFLFVLWRFGWLEASGVTRSGTLSAWLITLLITGFEIATHMLPAFGSLELEIPDPGLSISVAINAMATGFIEEIPYRGIVLYAFIRTWGNSKAGIAMSVVCSSLIFGASHLIHILLGRPVAQAIFVAVSASLAGIYYAAFVLRWKTIWTVVVFHGLLNAVASMKAIETPDFMEAATSAWGWILGLQLPVVVYGIYLIYRISPRSPDPETASLPDSTIPIKETF